MTNDPYIPSRKDDWDAEYKRLVGKWPFEGSYDITMLDGRREVGGYSTGIYLTSTVISDCHITGNSINGVLING